MNNPHPTNLWNVIRFALENVTLERCLVPRCVEDDNELNAASPVGKALLRARPGDKITALVPGGTVTIQVISIIPQEYQNSPKNIDHHDNDTGREKDNQ